MIAAHGGAGGGLRADSNIEGYAELDREVGSGFYMCKQVVVVVVDAV